MVHECVHQARCLSIEAFIQGNCCAARAFIYNKRDDFSVVARFGALNPAAMSTQLPHTMLLAVS